MDYCGGIFDPDKLESQLTELDIKTSADNLWDSPEKAKKLMKDRGKIKDDLDEYNHLNNSFTEIVELEELAKQENEKELLLSCLKQLQELSKRINDKNLTLMFDDDDDDKNCFLEIHAGAGGTESQDWADMIRRMYCRWCERKGFSVEEIDEIQGEEAGIKSSNLHIKGKQAFGWLKCEQGVHRLVRISPFDSNARRHTSFASVRIYADSGSVPEVTINTSDLRIDTYRASGAGGQHVNRTDSAVRITHNPSGIVVQCQNDRSQHKNKANALKVLQARLDDAAKHVHKTSSEEKRGGKTDIGWGHQIRSYVLQPYQMAKDLRTGWSEGNVKAVLDGDIDEFLRQSLASGIDGAILKQKV